MHKQDLRLNNDKIIITQLTRKFSSELIPLFRSNEEDTSVLYHGPICNVLEPVKLLPHMTNLVAYHTIDKTAVGFITLEETTNNIFSIKNVFVDPRYRKLGIGSELLNYVLTLAKEKGAEKLNLNVFSNKTSVIELYKKIGFSEIGHTRLVQGSLSGFSTFKIFKRIVFGKNYPKINSEKAALIKAKLNSSKDNETLFRIYKRCMPKDWLDFFEINPTNLKYGSRQVWQPHFFKEALVSRSEDSFALVYNRLYPLKDIVEVYEDPDTAALPFLEDLLKILSKRGIGLTQFWLFGSTQEIPSKWFEEKGMKIFDFQCMVKKF